MQVQKAVSVPTLEGGQVWKYFDNQAPKHAQLDSGMTKQRGRCTARTMQRPRRCHAQLVDKLAFIHIIAR